MFDRKAYMHRWYRRVVRKRRLEWLRANGPCVDCGSWSRLRVDHEDPASKVSHRIWTWSKDRREAELAKCRVRCHLCHAAKTRRENINRDVWRGKRKSSEQGSVQCSRCQKFLPVDAFHKDASAASGVYPACKECRRKYPSRQTAMKKPPARVTVLEKEKLA